MFVVLGLLLEEHFRCGRVPRAVTVVHYGVFVPRIRDFDPILGVFYHLLPEALCSRPICVCGA